jgi:hypothetical protein
MLMASRFIVSFVYVISLLRDPREVEFSIPRPSSSPEARTLSAELPLDISLSDD